MCPGLDWQSMERHPGAAEEAVIGLQIRHCALPPCICKVVADHLQGTAIELRVEWQPPIAHCLQIHVGGVRAGDSLVESIVVMQASSSRNAIIPCTGAHVLRPEIAAAKLPARRRA